ncbi:MAG: hypothetical protein OEY03_03690, partial [Rhizobacter sp.]|nr:hypothetical protein [Rhizobacter sp.]
VAADFDAAGLIDEMVLTTVPVRLERGIGLFGARTAPRTGFDTLQTLAFPNGLVQRRMARR